MKNFLLALFLVLSAGPAWAAVISGTVFEDKNYGGGNGRDLATAAGVGLAGARVELYLRNGLLQAVATTDANGFYSFTATNNINYTVRIVNGTVRSARPVLDATLTPLAVQTYQRGNIIRVGGTTPRLVDAGPGTFGITDFDNLTTGTTTAQSSINVNLGTANFLDTNFGFSFSVIVNVNDSGQGSLRQFLLNANALSKVGLQQAGLPANTETSIFMISNGQAQPGLRAGLTDLLTGTATARRAVINATTILPALAAANSRLDGTTQTANVRDVPNGNAETNSGLFGTGGTVGTESLTLSRIGAPEVEITAPTSVIRVVELAATGGVVRGVALHGAANGLIVSAAAVGALVETNLIGTSAVNAGATPTPAVQQIGLSFQAATGTVRNNLIGYNGSSGLNYSAGQGTAGLVVRGNEFVQNGRLVAGGDGLSVGDQGAAGPTLIEGNLIRLSNSSGIQFDIASISNNTVRNNTILGNGTGGTSSRLEGSGIHYLARNGTTTGSSNTDLLFRNVITENQSSGIVINYGQKNVTISQNSLFDNGNGTLLGKGLISIDFTAADRFVGGTADYGQGDGVTTNEGGFDERQGNRGIDYPIITNTSISADGKLVLEGYVGRRTGRPAALGGNGNNSRFGGATIEVFKGDNISDNNQNGPTEVGDGDNVPHGEARFYIGTITADANGEFGSVILIQSANVIAGDPIMATATLAGSGTSEAGVNLDSDVTVLPVELTEFTATAGGADARLSWATASELNNERFVVERSADGRQFEPVGTVAGHGTTQQAHRYAHTDVGAARAGRLLYYRLRQEDTDGRINFSPVRIVRFEGAGAGPVFTLHPNPTQAGTTLDLTAEAAGQSCRVLLRDLQGRRLHSFGLAGGQRHLLPTAALPAGTYLVEVRGAGAARTQRLVKQ
ncbi:MAG: right-handed parallel beta-helix repeat-containing protein [Hymenobacter sp.]|nr:right-handed parallel beta-helix repeat-containing protein [Hymenobacter sp.]